MKVEHIDCFFDESTDRKNKKYLTLIIYDISDNKRRLKMVKLLEEFGYRVQKSAFEALLDKKKLDKLLSRLSLVVHPDDLVKVYQLKGASEAFSWGNIKDIEDDEVLFI